MPAVDQCPDAGRWGDLLDSRLSGPAADSLSSHLESCPRCQRTLDNLTAGEATWVEAARGHDPGPRPELRRAIDRLKAEGEAALDTAGPTTISTLPFLRPSTEPGHIGRIGPYEVQGVIGRGGMGVVLKAFDPALRRPVAIKVLAPQWALHAQARERFEREARAAARVRHDNVVAIHAVEEADGLPYLVMEYVSGTSLQQRLDQDGPLDIEEVLRIGAQAAAGLAAAHAQDLVHRDVKPANILLDANDNVRLTDFGLARAVDDTSLTQSGVIAGTPQYMAPEQARGEKLDARSDLFSLGSVLYAMCTGRPPFRAPTTVAVLKRVCDEDPRDVRDLNPDVPGWLAQIIDKLHAKRPRDRFRNADEVARLLRRHLKHLREPDAVERPGPVGRRPASTLSIWVVALVVPGALGLALLGWGVMNLLTPDRPTNQSADAQGPPPVNPGPHVPAPPGNDDVYFQKVWADLDSADHFTRKTAVERLANIKPNDRRAEVARKLVALSEVEDSWVRWAAVRGLGSWGTEAEVPALIGAVAHRDVFTRKEALKVIGRFRDPRTLAPVVQAFRENSTRGEAGQALRDLGPMSEPELLAIVRDPDANIFLRRDAIKVLGDVGTAASERDLKEVAAAGNFHLAGPAREALEGISKRK